MDSPPWQGVPPALLQFINAFLVLILIGNFSFGTDGITPGITYKTGDFRGPSNT